MADYKTNWRPVISLVFLFAESVIAHDCEKNAVIVNPNGPSLLSFGYLYQISENSIKPKNPDGNINTCSVFNYFTGCEGLYWEEGGKSLENTSVYNTRLDTVVKYIETVQRTDANRHIYQRTTNKMIIKQRGVIIESEEIQYVSRNVKIRHQMLYALIGKGTHWLYYQTCEDTPTLWVIISTLVNIKDTDSVEMRKQKLDLFTQVKKEIDKKTANLNLNHVKWKTVRRNVPDRF